MVKALLVGAGVLALAAGQAMGATPAEEARWKAHAAATTITRDDWGIAHVHGHSDADAVFGMIYAQAEDDFARVEANYLTNLGRTAEADGAGDKAVWADLRQRLYTDPVTLQKEYAASPPWLQALMQGWADGLNFYLAGHPAIHPRVLTHFEPWMALSFTEGSIGGDIERIPLSGLQSFMEKHPVAPTPDETGAKPKEPKGSNGIALSGRITANGHPLLLINPHTSFYFRSELEMSSDTGLLTYGAATWGQFFIYQGWNEKTGWMHTSSGVDAVDEFAEDVEMRGAVPYYKFGAQWRAMTQVPITLHVRRADGTLGERHFVTWRTHRGPVVREADGKWISFAMMWRPVAALQQSWLRTRQSDLASFMKVAALQANSSNDTLFADQKGEIAYLHPQFVPIRDNRFDYTRPVDGSDPATDWKGLHTLASLPQAINPREGWAFNTNNEPWHAAGPDSPVQSAFPRYMDQAGENERGRHALLLLTGKSGWTHEKLRDAAFDSFLPGFARLLPPLMADYDALAPFDPRRAALVGPITLLRGWDHRWGLESAPTSLAVVWGDTLAAQVGAKARTAHLPVPDYIITRSTPEERLAALQAAVDRLKRDFGDWHVAWGKMNRFQRLDDSIAPHFDDAQPSVPVPFTSALWGSLASFGAKSYPNTRNYYGNVGNSFVAIVEFGPRVKGWAVTAGGESGNPASPHFADQIERYVGEQLRPVYFWPDELKGHVEKVYHPGGQVGGKG